MDLRETDEQQFLRRAVREFAEAEIRPNVMAWDEAQAFPKELLPKLAGVGLMGIQVPEAWGGAAHSSIAYCICIEELARVDPSIALSVAAHNGLAVAHLVHFASDEQKTKYLKPLAEGKHWGAWALTESSSGSDAATMRTTARLDGDSWVLSGTKQFITHGAIGETIVVMAVTDREQGPRGISAFIVPRGAPGLKAGKKENKLGMRASDTSEVVFEECRVPASAIIGAPGEGFTQAMQILDAGRIGIAALAVGLAQGAYDAARRYSLERRAFGQRISEFQAIRWKIADMVTRIQAARLLTYRAAWTRDNKDNKIGRTSLASSIAKLYSSEIAVRVAEEGVQIHGGYGFVKDYPAEKYFRDVKLCTIGEGTSEIQRLVIGRQLLGGCSVNAPLAARILDRDPRAIARAISLIEDESPDAAELVGSLFANTGRAYLIGVTGPPGAGKSTLVDRLIAELRKSGQTVGVIAVDPTSPYTGGAILGDRVRMQSHAQDAGVFIRSMATRGHLGGLARTTAEAAIVLDAAGFDIVIIETVGVGQDEVDIVRTADVSIVTLVPGTGDEVQALKAGIMEIADIFVVNKADREGADRTAASIETMLSLEMWPEDEWRPPVIRTVATTGSGLGDLVAAIDRFRAQSADEQGVRRRARAEWRLREMLERRFMQHVDGVVLGAGEFTRLLDRIAAREIDPYTATESVMTRALGGVRGVASPLDHVGIAVRDAGAVATIFQSLLGLETGDPEVVGQHRLRFVEAGGPTLELVEALSADAPVGKFLEKRGEGLHHLCFRVADIDHAIADLRARGIRFIDESARPGAHGSRIAFIHPSSAGGLLIELKQAAAHGAGA